MKSEKAKLVCKYLYNQGAANVLKAFKETLYLLDDSDLDRSTISSMLEVTQHCILAENEKLKKEIALSNIVLTTDEIIN